MDHHMAKLRVPRALRHNIPNAAGIEYEIGQRVLIWREKMVANRIGEWMGPYVVEGVNREGKQVYVKDVEVGPARPFGLAQVKPYVLPTHMFLQDLAHLLGIYASCKEDGGVFMTEKLQGNGSRANTPEMM